MMEKGEFLNNDEIRQIYVDLFGENPGRKTVYSIKNNIVSRKMYTAEVKLIDKIKCIKVTGIEKVVIETREKSEDLIDPGLWRPDSMHRLINNVMRS